MLSQIKVNNQVVTNVDDIITAGSKNLINNNSVSEYVNRDNFKLFVMGLNGIDDFIGNIDTTFIDTLDSNGVYKVINVKYGDYIEIKSTPYTRVAILKDFDFNTPGNQYNLIFADGETSRRQNSTGMDFVCPYDAKYVLIQTIFSYGVREVNFHYFKINNVDYLNKIDKKEIQKTPIEYFYSPYFSSNNTFGLSDVYNIMLYKNALIKCVWYSDINIERVGIFLYEKVKSYFYLWFANCDSLEDGELISNDNVFAKTYSQIEIDSNSNTQKFYLFDLSNNIIGYVIIDLTILNLITQPIETTTPTTYANSSIKLIESLSVVSNYYSDLYAEKTIDSLKLYKRMSTGQYVMYPLNYRFREYTQNQYPSFYDNWGIGIPTLCEYNGSGMTTIANLFNGAEAELALTTPDLKDGSYTFVGGAMHGFENITTDNNGNRNVRMLINGTKIDETDIFDLMPVTNVDVLEESQICPAYTNTDSFAIVTKHWQFSKDGLNITTKLNMTRSVNFAQAYFGMFGILRHWKGQNSEEYLANKAIKNNSPFNEFDLSDDWENDPSTINIRTTDRDCTEIKLYGQKDIGSSLKIINATTKTNGGMSIRTNGGQQYNKVYFDLTGGYTPAINEELYATQIWLIE